MGECESDRFLSRAREVFSFLVSAYEWERAKEQRSGPRGGWVEYRRAGGDSIQVDLDYRGALDVVVGHGGDQLRLESVLGYYGHREAADRLLGVGATAEGVARIVALMRATLERWLEGDTSSWSALRESSQMRQ